MRGAQAIGLFMCNKASLGHTEPTKSLSQASTKLDNEPKHDTERGQYIGQELNLPCHKY